MHQHSGRKILFLLLFAGAAVFRVLTALGPRMAATYYDELFYLELAQNLWQSGSISVYAAPLNFTKLLYPLVLAPFYAVSGAAARITAISVFNALLCTSALIPGYLLACRMLKNDRHILLSVLLLALCPDMCFSMTYMAENLYLPLLIWGFYFVFLAWEREGGSPCRYILPGFWSFLLYAAKEAGIAFPAGVAGILLFRFFRNAGSRKQRLAELSCFVLSFGVPAAAVRFILLGGVGYSYSSQVSLSRLASAADAGFLLYASALLLLCFFITCCYAPAAFPLIQRRSLTPAERRQSLLAYLYILFIAVGTAFGVYLYESDGQSLGRIHLRYFIGAFWPLLLCFFAAESPERPEPDRRKRLAAWIASGVFLLGVFLLVPRPQVGALVDSPAYYYTNLLAAEPAGEWILKGGVCLAVAVMLAFRTWKRRWLLPAAAVLLLAFELLNTVLFIPAAQEEYSLPDPAAQEEACLLDDCLDRLDGTLLVIHDDQYSPTIRVLNTWLKKDYMLLLSGDLWEIMQTVRNTGAISPEETALPVPLLDFRKADHYPASEIDYVLLLDPFFTLVPECYEDITPEGFTAGRLYRSLDPSVLCVEDPDLYTPGEVISFVGRDADFRKYTSEGFSYTEDYHTWTEGPEASIRLRPDMEEPGFLVLSWTWLDTIEMQRCRVSVNEKVLFDGILEGGGSMELAVKPEFWTGSMVLKFEFPDARKPDGLDPRILAVAFLSLCLQ